jgi:hypothetical protein
MHGIPQPNFRVLPRNRYGRSVKESQICWPYLDDKSRYPVLGDCRWSDGSRLSRSLAYVAGFATPTHSAGYVGVTASSKLTSRPDH